MANLDGRVASRPAVEGSSPGRVAAPSPVRAVKASQVVVAVEPSQGRAVGKASRATAGPRSVPNPVQVAAASLGPAAARPAMARAAMAARHPPVEAAHRRPGAVARSAELRLRRSWPRESEALGQEYWPLRPRECRWLGIPLESGFRPARTLLRFQQWHPPTALPTSSSSCRRRRYSCRASNFAAVHMMAHLALHGF